MRTIVVGDIHGCCKELKQLISELIECKKYNPKKDRLIFLGDYIDRGDDPRGVIRYIRRLQEKYDNVIALMGNHEDMMIKYSNGDKYSGWEYNGYEKTLWSYAEHKKELADDYKWMKNLPLYFEDEHRIYVHAGIEPGVPMENQKRETLLWVRDNFIYDCRDFSKRVIFGHTPDLSSAYKTIAGNIGIDTGCVFGGKLTALLIDADGIEQEIYSVEKEADEEGEETDLYDYSYDY